MTDLNGMVSPELAALKAENFPIADSNGRVIDENGVVQEEEDEPGMSLDLLASETYYPRHLAKLDMLEDISDDMRIYLHGMYLGREPRKFETFINRRITAIGSMVWEHSPFVGMDGRNHPGFYQVLIALEEKDDDGVNKVMGTSSKVVGEQMFFIMKKRGWYLWKNSDGTPAPITFLCSKEHKAHRLLVVNRVLKDEQK